MSPHCQNSAQFCPERVPRPSQQQLRTSTYPDRFAVRRDRERRGFARVWSFGTAGKGNVSKLKHVAFVVRMLRS